MAMVSRRPYLRPYLFEVVTVANLALIEIFSSGLGISTLSALGKSFAQFLPVLVGYTAAGVIVRIVVAVWRGNVSGYLTQLRSPGWLTDTLRLCLFGVLTMHTYFWIKLLVPLLHPRLFDQQLWDLDQMLFLGLSPNILLLELFSQPLTLRVIDWSYARIFFVSMTVGFTFFLSAAERRLRIAFTSGNTIMWLVGAWLYLLIPSVGPAYRFPEVWMPLASGLPMTQHFQALLMKNYSAIIRLAEGVPITGAITLAFGIGAFPSLHVAFQTYAFLWMRRVWIYGQIVFGVFMVTIFIGSIVTGWHYFIDSVAGLALAALCYLLSSRSWEMPRWLRLRRAIRSEFMRTT